MLDDVFAELDVTRRDRLAGLVADADQVLITAAVPADVPAALGGVRLLVTPDGDHPDGITPDESTPGSTASDGTAERRHGRAAALPTQDFRNSTTRVVASA